MASYGLVVEGTYDTAIYTALVSRLTGNPKIYCREAGGIPQLNKLLRALLRDLEHAADDTPVDKALVLRDADGKTPDLLAAALLDRLKAETFAFPNGIAIGIAVQTIETWLLSDVGAINSVAASHTAGGFRAAEPVAGNLEEIANPKRLLGRVLVQTGLPFTAEICREITMAIDLGLLRQRCPSFGRFEATVLG